MDDDLGGIAGGSRRGKSLGEADFGANIAVSKEVEELEVEIWGPERIFVLLSSRRYDGMNDWIERMG